MNYPCCQGDSKGNSSPIVQPDYDEEGNLVKLSHFDGTNTTTAYEYGYAYDNKRRWKKDYANSLSTWYPCGVACSAGQLVELVSDLTGQVWNTSILYISDPRAPDQPLRSNGVYSHYDLFGNAAVQTDASGNVTSQVLYDRFGVQRSFGPQPYGPQSVSQTRAAKPKRARLTKPDRNINQPPQNPQPPIPRKGNCSADRAACMAGVIAVAALWTVATTAALTAGIALCNIDPDPISKGMCIVFVYQTARAKYIDIALVLTGAIACCADQYNECVANGGTP